jgi:hypothetical protein
VYFDRCGGAFDVVTWCVDHQVIASSAAVKYCGGVDGDDFTRLRETSITL